MTSHDPAHWSWFSNTVWSVVVFLQRGVRRNDLQAIIASVASNLQLKGWEAQTNISKQGGTFWQGELASLRVTVSGASDPKRVVSCFV
jgi:hypothetical protein